MPNLYFCQPHAKNQGMLRAVLSVHECERVVGRQHATYLGEQFPKVFNGPESAEDFALLSFHPDETAAAYRFRPHKTQRSPVRTFALIAKGLALPYTQS